MPNTLSRAGSDTNEQLASRLKGDGKSFSIPTLDGFRAVAVLIVFLAHADWSSSIPGGFGVTIFFFLSGYLITTLLRREYEARGDISFSRFYLRRALRLFPPLYIVMCMIGLTIWLTGDWIKHDMTVGGVLSQVFYWANYYYILYGGTHFLPFGSIYWSLAIEEHFYLLFPLLFAMSLKVLSLKRFAWILIVTCVAVLIWRIVLVVAVGVSDSYTYRATDARFDSLLFGCLLAVSNNPAIDAEFRISIRFKVVLLCTSLLLILGTFLYREEVFRGTVRYSIQGVSLFVIFWMAIRHSNWPIFSWLNWSALRRLGAYSYAFYLSHMFFLFIAGELSAARGVARAALGFVLTLAFCALLHKYVEAPISRYRVALR